MLDDGALDALRERYRTDPVYREKVKARVKAREQAKRASRV